MLTIKIPDCEMFNEKTNEFIPIKGRTLQLEHSLISLRKWESKWHKPFLSDKPKTEEETLDYVRCMTLTPNVDPILYRVMPVSMMEQIAEYIKDPMTATWFGGSEEKKKKTFGKRVITAEVIYYWMIELGIPIELEKWHVNQLFTLIQVISIERTPKKKMSKKELLSKYSNLNAQRLAKLNTRG